MSFDFKFPQTPSEILKRVTEQVRQAREGAGLSRQEIAERTGIAYSTYKHFEDTGQISLERLLKVAEVLGYLEAFAELFSVQTQKSSQRVYQSLDEVERDHEPRKNSTRRMF